MELIVEYILAGFLAQLVDGALGMAYGVISTTLLLTLGYPPVIASATTHMSECITSAFSAISHHQFGNIDKNIFRRIVLPGVIGSVAGAYILTQLNGETIKPFVATYLMVMGLIILTKSFYQIPPRPVKHLVPLGLSGGMLDAIGGGGWGPIVTSSLLANGQDPRMAIGSVNAAEFFVATASSLTFFFTVSDISFVAVASLAIGGAIAAPFGAWIAKHVAPKILLFIVGILIIILSSRILLF